jgi:hypothetical protein
LTRCRLFGQDDAVLDLAFHRHDDQQDALVRQAQEFDLRNAGLRRGVITSPANWLRSDSRVDAAVISRCGSDAVRLSFRAG